MMRKSLNFLAVAATLALGASFVAAADTPQSGAKLSAAAVVEKNVAARGGLQAWRSVHVIAFTGKMAAGGNRRATIPVPMPDPKATPEALPKRPAEETLLPYTLELARPRKMRLELTFNGQKAIQVYDGTNGWKLRPFLNRRVVENYTPEELKAASTQAELDGPLVDYAAKGTKVALDGMDTVDGRDTYKLKLTMKDGRVVHIWIDANSFLEAKMDGLPRRLDGVDHAVEVYYRDYHTVNGLQIPYLIETHVLPLPANGRRVVDTQVPPERITVETVVVNPNIEESAFAKPEVAMASK